MNRASCIDEIKAKAKEISDSRYLSYLIDNADSLDFDSKICVQIPAYNDTELIRTMEGCLANASNPDRITFAVCYQGDNKEQLDKVKAFKNCRVKHVPEAEVAGTCAARYECNKLLEDEEYVLHIDGHMMFSRFWDVAAIQQWKDCNDEKAVISCYSPNSVDYFDEPITSDKLILKQPNGRYTNATHFENDEVKVRLCAIKTFDDGEIRPRRGIFVCGHCTFAKSELDREVPFDPHMYFTGDEMSMSVRYFTHGYNVYNFAFRMIYHLYYRSDVVEKKKNVKLDRFNTTNAHSCGNRNNESRRMEQLYEVADHGIDLGEFGNGTVRTMKEFTEFSGIDFKNHTMTVFAARGAFDVEHTEEDNALTHWELLHPEVLTKREDAERKNKKILVMIPSYKDPYLTNTVLSFIGNADNPDRVHISICYQDDDMLTLHNLKTIKNCQVIHVPTKDAKGVGHAYHLLEGTLTDEEYVLCTESHMYAVKGWDTYLTKLSDSLGDKAVISDWSNGFDVDKVPTGTQRGLLTRIRGVGNDGRLLTAFGDIITSDKPIRGCAIIGQNVFGKACFIRDCKHDPDMLMSTSGTAYSLSLWTHGYDVYHSPLRYLYHYYSSASNAKDETRLKINEVRRKEEETLSAPRLKKYVGIIDNANVDIDLGEYAPGTARSIKAFEDFAGIDFKKQLISARAFFGYFNGDMYVANPYIDVKKLEEFQRKHNFDARYTSEQVIKRLRTEENGIKYLGG